MIGTIDLRDDQRVDFIYRIDGLASFATEWRRAMKMIWTGQVVKVLPLARVIRSKEISNRPKDPIQLPALRDYLACLEIARPAPAKGLTSLSRQRLSGTAWTARPVWPFCLTSSQRAAPESKRDSANKDDQELAGDKTHEPEKCRVHEAVAMQPDAQHVHPKP